MRPRALPMTGTWRRAWCEQSRHRKRFRRAARARPLNVGGASTPPRDAASGKTARPAKAATRLGKPAPPRFSKDWFNQQLGRPYVLYPLCAVILFGALWFSFGNPFGGQFAAAVIPVTFDVQPDAKGLEVLSGKESRAGQRRTASMPSQPGHHALTFRKEGFHPAHARIDVTPRRTSSR